MNENQTPFHHFLTWKFFLIVLITFAMLPLSYKINLTKTTVYHFLYYKVSTERKIIFIINRGGSEKHFYFAEPGWFEGSWIKFSLKFWTIFWIKTRTFTIFHIKTDLGEHSFWLLFAQSWTHNNHNTVIPNHRINYSCFFRSFYIVFPKCPQCKQSYPYFLW